MGKLARAVSKAQEIRRRNTENTGKNLLGVYVGSKDKPTLEQVAEVIKLLEAEDKTLTLLAYDLDVELWKAMKIADYGKKAVMAEVKEKGKELTSELQQKKQVLPEKDYDLWMSEVLGQINGVKEFMRRLGV